MVQKNELTFRNESGAGHSVREERRRRRRELGRREILEAARRVFAAKGYSDAAMEEIAAYAGYSVGSLYNFFSGKAELYAEVLKELAREMMDAFRREVFSLSDPVKALERLIALWLESVERHRGVFAAVFRGQGLGPTLMAELPAEVARARTEYVDLLTGLFRRGVEKGVFAPFEPVYMALVLEGMVNAFVAWWSDNESEGGVEERARRILQAFMNGAAPRPETRAEDER